jgi:hypothetical protein
VLVIFALGIEVCMRGWWCDLGLFGLGKKGAGRFGNGGFGVS